MAEMYLVRHGQASFGAENYDCLSALGERQSVRLGEYFAAQGLEFDTVITGSQRRHRQTAAGILAGMRSGQACEEDPDFNEYDFQCLCRLAVAQHPNLASEMEGDLRAFYRGLKRVLKWWSEDAIKGDVPENWADFRARVARARERIQGSGYRRLLVVSSGGVIAATTQQVLDAPHGTAIELNLQIYNSSLSRYFFNSGAFALGSFNNIPHLRPLEDTELVTYG